MNFIKNHSLILGGLLLIFSLIMTLYIPLFVVNHMILGFYLIANILSYIGAFALFFNYFDDNEGFYIVFVFIGLIMFVNLDIKNEYIKENNNVYKVRYIKTFLTDYKMVFKHKLKIKNKKENKWIMN